MEDEDELDIFALEDKIRNGEMLDEVQEEQKKIFLNKHKKVIHNILYRRIQI